MRRRLLQGAAGSLLLPRGAAFAQSGTALLRAPKQALVIGNSKYGAAPLRNPSNDATAIAAQLKAVGFDVTVLQDLGREPMVGAIQAYAASLAKRKAVGLFYYAGHGVQLAWRNFLVPVDAVIDRQEDIQTRCVDVGALVEGITKAANPMNVVILDACRDNPFGSARPPEQKGLSQLDAPPGTLLAYATAPGNVASDGEGANGLYTEHLLRELQVPEAKIEDVFKRVRLGVRRKSNGRQIPWESTSLEEDFYFRPPEHLKKLSEEEKKKLFEEQLAVWESIQYARDPGRLEEFLRRYPSGEFSELAQLQLDRVLARQGEQKIRIATTGPTPYSAGTGIADTAWKAGDTYVYRSLDLYTRIESRQRRHTVKEVTENEIIFSSGMILDHLGNFIRAPDGRRFSANQARVPEYSVGKRWSFRSVITNPKGETGELEMSIRVVGREKIQVPAGTFDCFRIEGEGWARFPSATVGTRQKAWLAPDRLRMHVASEDWREVKGRITVAERNELVSFSQT